MKQAHRFSGHGQPYAGLTEVGPQGARWTGKVVTVPEVLDAPLRWKEPHKIFVNSMSDLFHEDVPTQFIDAVWATMAEARHHTFQILTKRPERMREYMLNRQRAGWRADWNNIHLGVSVEDQKTADERIAELLETPAAVRWVSGEPLLGKIDFRAYLDGQEENGVALGRPAGTCVGWRPPLDWIVVGGESGPGARPMHPEWVRSIRDQCQVAGVPFFFKQWGEWGPYLLDWDVDEVESAKPSGFPPFKSEVGNMAILRLGKKRAGNRLDGRVWEEFPETA